MQGGGRLAYSFPQYFPPPAEFPLGGFRQAGRGGREQTPVSGAPSHWEKQGWEVGKGNTDSCVPAPGQHHAVRRRHCSHFTDEETEVEGLAVGEAKLMG